MELIKKLLMMLTALIALPAFSQDFEYEGIWYQYLGNGTCSTHSSATGNLYSGDIVIPSTVSDGNKTYTVTEIGIQTFYGCDELYSVTLPETITVINEYAFTYCTNIVSVNFPTPLTTIEGKAFEGCKALSSAKFGEGLKTVGHRAFAECDSLKSVSFSGDVTLIGEWAFYRCFNLASVNFSGSVGTIGSCAFYRCSSLKLLSFSKTVISIETEAFYGCSELSSVVFPESLLKLGYESFDQCYNLKTISLPASLSEFEDNVFAGCYNISEVNYQATDPHEFNNDSQFEGDVYNNAKLNAPNAKLADIRATYPWSLFRYINALDGSSDPVLDEGTDFEYDGIWYTVISSDDKTCETRAGESDGDVVIPGNNVSGDIVIPSRVTLESNDYTVIGVGHDGFINNSQLNSIRLPETLTYIGDSSFNGCSGLTSFNFPRSLTELGAYAFQNCTGFTTMEIPSTVTSIGAGLFADCSNLSSVNLPNSIISIGLNTFARCTNLKDFEIPASVTSIGTGAFIHCTSLSTMTIPESVESIGISSFAHCIGLTSISIPSSVITIGIGAFAECAGLTTVYLPSGLKFLDSGAFAECDAILKVSYPAVSPIAADSDVFSNSAYANATLDMPNASVSDIRSTVPWSLFGHVIAVDGTIGFVTDVDDFEYDGIWYTVLDPDVKTAKTKDKGNHATGNVVVPAQVSDGENDYSVIEIGNGSFQGSDKLLSINLPVTILSIGDNAFSGCPSLTSLVWNSHTKLSDRVVEEIGNLNLLLYVDSLQFAPDGMTANVVADGVCDNLVLSPGHAFTPVYEFTSLHSSMVKDFRQKTIIGRAAGWETIVLPFDATEVYAENLESYMTPFAALTEIYSQRPYWLYKADADEGWTVATAIEAGIPYIISMPNNTAYVSGYNVDGPVVFSNPQPHRISSTVTAPYAVTWTSGREFRSLWIPLTEAEAVDAMGLNVGLSNLKDDEGQPLAPGSAFHADVVPQPLEAYVTRLGAERAMRIIGNQSAVIPVLSENGLDIRVEDGVIYARSDTDRTIHIYNPEGVAVRTVALKSGTTVVVDGLTPGIYLSSGRKLIVR